MYKLEKSKLTNISHQNEVLKEANDKFISIIRDYQIKSQKQKREISKKEKVNLMK